MRTIVPEANATRPATSETRTDRARCFIHASQPRATRQAQQKAVSIIAFEGKRRIRRGGRRKSARS